MQGPYLERGVRGEGERFIEIQSSLTDHMKSIAYGLHMVSFDLAYYHYACHTDIWQSMLFSLDRYAISKGSI